MKRCFLIGQSLKQSYSKEIHEMLNNYYELLELDEKDFASFIESREYEMVNVTMPYKRLAASFCDKLDEISEKTNVVNTIINRDGVLYGYNTDYYGFAELTKGYDFTGKNVLILGTGATKDTIKYYLDSFSNVSVYYGTSSSADGVNSFAYENISAFSNVINVVINTTPVGTYPNSYITLVDIEKFKNIERVFDVVYNPINTKLVATAKVNGIEAKGGLLMLVAQAVKANAILKDINYNADLANQIYTELLYKKQNVVLIGLPGSGKTSVGQMLSIYTFKPLLDTDSLIEEKINESILEYFENHTEEEFRNIEKETIKAISLTQGNIISTGGGVVLNKENMISLKMNGKIYFLDRNIDDIKITKSRPLTTSYEELVNINKERRSLYLKYADVILDNNQSLDLIVRKVMEQ